MSKAEEDKAKELREKFLADVSRRLSDRLDAVALFESVDEMRTHLNTLAASNESNGMSSHDAMKAALKKFGSARRIARGMTNPSLAWKVVGFFVTITACGTVGALLVLLEFMSYFHGQIPGGKHSVFLELGLGEGAVVGSAAWIATRVTHIRPIYFGALLTVILDLYVDFCHSSRIANANSS